MPPKQAPARRRKPSESDFLRCRVIKHSWDTVTDTASTASLDLLCVRCTTERHDWINGLGALETRNYIYPDGYKLARGEVRPSVADMRIMLIAELTTAAGKPRRRTR